MADPASIAAIAGAGSKGGGDVAKAVATGYAAKQDYKARVVEAKERARGLITVQSIDEASEILTVNDRPFFRYKETKGNVVRQYDISLHTVSGILSLVYAMERELKYRQYVEDHPLIGDTMDLLSNTPINKIMDNFIATIGYAPLSNPVVMNSGKMGAVNTTNDGRSSGGALQNMMESNLSWAISPAGKGLYEAGKYLGIL